MKPFRRFSGLAAGLLAFAQPAVSQVLINEIMYHPVERAAFDTNGIPVLDLSDDVHEFIELHNTNSVSVNLAGWRLSGGIDFQFPIGAAIAPGSFAVVAKDPARLTAIPSYGLTLGTLFGPYAGQLGNDDGDTVRLRNTSDDVVDSATYYATFPWPIGANALGADDEWTGLSSSNFQYRGRSLERVSVFSPANDPANWLGSSLTVGPTPGRSNTVRFPVPRPIVIQLTAGQATDGSGVIRSNQPVRIDATFSSTNLLANVLLEYFLDDINVTNETRPTIPMSPVGPGGDGRYTVVMPARPDRTIVRYRIRAERGAGLETISPRTDDPFPWHAYFVTPARTSANPIYDVFISSASLSRLSVNIGQSPRRIALPDPPGLPRDSWNATEPAVFVNNGVVYDIRMRHHGSRYNRSPTRKSYKFQFPDYARFNGRTSYFETDKAEEHRLGAKLYEAVDLPVWRARYVDVYLNADSLDGALEQEEIDKDTYRRWIGEQETKYPDAPRQHVGETYKATGVVPFETASGQGTTGIYENSGEGPYYIGNEAPIPAKAGWSINDRYAWTYGLQVDQWRGGLALRQLVDGLWVARGDTPTAPNPSLGALRAFLAANFDLDATLSYIAIRNWSAPFDNATHNHFVWQRGEGKWGLLPWDLDVEFTVNRASQSVFWDEYAFAQPDALRGPNWIKDSFLKAYREEYKQKLFILNNTLLAPTGLTAIGAGGLSAYATTRQPVVNSQLALGPWYAPQRPTNVAPAATAVVFSPAALQGSPYLHTSTSNPPPAHARTTWIVRHASGGSSNTVLRLTTSTNLTSLPIPFDRLTFGESYFWKCIYLDADNHPSAESVETSFVYGAPPAPGEVRLNEILADNMGSALNGSFAPDYIEIANATDTPKSLSQLTLSDDPAQPSKFAFPPGTILPANGLLIVWCDHATNAPGFHAGFQLDNDGQTVLLFAVTNGVSKLIDTVTFGLQLPGHSIGRSGSVWVLTEPTPGGPNIPVAVASPATLRINEWMASAAAGPDWFELYNPEPLPMAVGGLYLGDSPAQRTNSRLAALSFVAPSGHRRLYADEDLQQGARHVNFRLSASGDSILLSAEDLTTLDMVAFGPQTTDVSQGRLPDGSATMAAFPGSASPEAANHLRLTDIVINELLPGIELRNPGGAPISIAGWWLSDDPLVPQKYAIPVGTIVPAGGLWATDDVTLPFHLDSVSGGRVVLSHDGYRVEARFGPGDGHSYGPVTTSVGIDFVRLASPTFGAANSPPVVGPVVISEIQYHPPDLAGDNDDYEFVELANMSAGPVPLHFPGFPEIAWRLRDAVSFAFPNGTTLAAGEHVLVVGFDPSTNSAARSNFFAAYSLPPGGRVFGPYSGKLDNAGASVELVALQLPVAIPGPNYGVMPEVLLERVRYGDATPWPTEADGAGPSLQRRVLASYGNEPLNWFANGVTPGDVSRTNALPTVSVTGPLAGSALPYNQPIGLSAQALDSDGNVRRVEFFADASMIGAATAAPFEVVWTNAAPGPHGLTARAIDDRLGITISAAVPVTISNSPPSVALTAPAAGTSFALPTNIVFEAIAQDLDGDIVKVEFYADGVRVGEAANPPYRYSWPNARCSSYTLTARAIDDGGGAGVSSGVGIATTRDATIAYQVETNVVGSQSLPNPYGIGMDFTVLSPVIVTHLGCFDSGSDGLNPSSTLTTQIFNRNGVSPVVAVTTNFSATDPGVLIGGSRFKPLSAPVVLTNGSYSVVGYGYDANNRNGNLGTGNSKAWATDDGCGLLAFVGGGRYGAVTPGSFPGTLDAGPADRYAAGTFQFRKVTPAPTVVSQPAGVLVRSGATTNFTVIAIGDAPLRYQWQYNGTPISNATNATLIVSNIQASNEGAYRVVISNGAGTAESAAATLTLAITPGFVVRPFDQFVVSNGTFTVSVVLTGAPPPFRYEWREGATTRGVTITNARTNFFSFGPNNALGTRNWRLVVTNAAAVAPGSTLTFNVTVLPDTDGDGLPDEWEIAFGLNQGSAADRVQDSDGDGQLNWQEYQAGTNPKDAASYLRIDSIEPAGGAALTFGALSNRTYSVEVSSAIGGPWAKHLDVIAQPTNRVERLVDPTITPGRFYRLASPSQP